MATHFILYLHKKHNQNHRFRSESYSRAASKNAYIFPGYILEVVQRFPRKTSQRDTIISNIRQCFSTDVGDHEASFQVQKRCYEHAEDVNFPHLIYIAKLRISMPNTFGSIIATIIGQLKVFLCSILMRYFNG